MGKVNENIDGQNQTYRTKNDKRLCPDLDHIYISMVAFRSVDHDDQAIILCPMLNKFKNFLKLGRGRQHIMLNT